MLNYRYITIAIILIVYSSEHTEKTRRASMLHLLKQKIIVRDHRSRHPQTLILLHINK